VSLFLIVLWAVALSPALPRGPSILQEVVRTHLLSDDLTARAVLDRVTSVIAKAHGKTA
jgi:hypothetical protein